MGIERVMFMGVGRGETGVSFGSLMAESLGRLSLIVAGTILVTVGNVFLRWGIGEALDRGKVSGALPVAAAVLLALNQVLSFQRQMLSVKMQKSLGHRMQSKVLRGTMEGLGKKDMGMVSTYYLTDSAQIVGAVERLLNKAFPDAVGWLITVGLIYWFHWLLGLAAVAVTVLPLLFMHRMSRLIVRGVDAYQAALEEANQSVVSGLHNIETIKTSCKEEKFLRDDREKLAALQRKKRVVAFWEAALGAPMLLGTFLTIVLLTALGGWLALDGQISAGQLLTVIALVDNIVSFVMSLDGTIAALRRGEVSRKRVNEFLALEEESLGDREVERVEEIAFDRIRFAYPGTGKEIYNGFSERWERGKVCFIKGGNGAGKSTLLKLLMGVYPVSSGEILINGIPLKEYSLTSLRERIVVVPQENMLFQGTIYENLAGQGRDAPGFSAEKCIEMCRKVGIHEEIMKMPEGYETVLTENGGVLSGGQKQRLCLARALLRDGDVYLLDEPTSALDKRHSEILMELLESLAHDRIVAVITHERDLADSEVCVVGEVGQDFGEACEG